MRSKEQAHDYRYFPEPDLLPLVVDEKWQAAIRASLPELPEARRQRMIKEYGITAGDAHTLTLTRAMADQFESAARGAKNPKRVANLVQSELLGRLKAQGLELDQSPISMAGVTTSADLVESGAISGKMLKIYMTFASIARRTSLPFMKPRGVPSNRGTRLLWKNLR